MTKRTIGTLVMTAAMALSLQGADITVIKRSAVKTPLDFSGLVVDGSKSAELFFSTLKNDLVLSGWFQIPAAEAALKVSGRCEQNGSLLNVTCRVANEAAGRLYLAEDLRLKIDDVRTPAHRLADQIVWEVKQVPGIASTRIAMVGARAAAKELYLCDPDGQDLVRVTNDDSICLTPRWGNNGQSLVYTSMHQGYPDIYRIDLTSGRRTRLVNFPGMNSGGSVSPDGKRLAMTLSKDGNPDLYVMNLDGGRLTRLTRTGHAAEASPSWSPAGDRLVFVSDSSGSPQIYILNARGGRPRRMTFQGTENVAPDWGPDGRIVYSSRRSGRYQVCVLDPEADERVQLTQGGADYEDPSWAPDSRHIVCSRTENYRSALYILDTLGDPPLRLTTLDGDWYSPAWSPE